MNGYKPQLLPNNEAGIEINWRERIENPIEWLWSFKKDGGRIAIKSDGQLLGRSLKGIPSKHMNLMAESVAKKMQLHPTTIVEGEFYAHDMTFSEIMHFFKTADVTSTETKNKYKKLWEKSDQGTNLDVWTYPGRDWQWLCDWHPELKFHLFDIVSTEHPWVEKYKRHLALGRYVERYNQSNNDLPLVEIIEQVPFESVDELLVAYDNAIDLGYEGIVVVNKYSEYKYGRHTLANKQIFKIKEDNLEFDGMILSVVEGTEAIDGAPKSTNELGRSVTSKLQEHRRPSGMAIGFEVLMEDGNTLTVSLKNYNHEERKELLYNHADYANQWIRFTGMKPVKEGGCPRHAHFTKGNFREAKV